MSLSITRSGRILLWGLTGLAAGYGMQWWGRAGGERSGAERKRIPVLEDRQARLASPPLFDAQAAAAELAKLDANGKAQKIRRLFELDPRATLTFLDELPDRALAAKLGIALLQQFPAHAFPMLREWAAARPDENGKYTLLAALIPYWVRMAPEEAMAFVETFADTPEKRALSGKLLNALQAEDRLALLQRLPQGLQQALLPDQAASFHASNPESAFAFITPLPASKAKTEALTNLLTHWVGPALNRNSDPKAAIAAVTALTDPEMRDLGFKSIASGWSKTNLAGVYDWVASLPAGEVRESALAGMITCLASESKFGMHTWSSGIWDPPARWRVLEMAGAEWLPKNADTAAGFIKDSRLFADEKRYLQSFLTPHP